MKDDPVVVFSSFERTDIMMAKSLLASAGIKFFVEDENAQDLIAWGNFGGVNPVVGPVKILVAGGDALDAKEILKDLDKKAKE